MRFFKRKHRHKWQFGSVFAGPAQTIKTRWCPVCGEAEHEYTPAGAQHLGAWMVIGMDYEHAKQRVAVGDSPFMHCAGGVRLREDVTV
jgi:hypothetical protein